MLVIIAAHHESTAMAARAATGRLRARFRREVEPWANLDLVRPLVAAYAGRPGAHFRREAEP